MPTYMYVLVRCIAVFGSKLRFVFVVFQRCIAAAMSFRESSARRNELGTCQHIKNYCRSACHHVNSSHLALWEAERQYEASTTADTAITHWRTIVLKRQDLATAMFVFDNIWNEDDRHARIQREGAPHLWINSNRYELSTCIQTWVPHYMERFGCYFDPKNLRKYRAMATGQLAEYQHINERHPAEWYRAEYNRILATVPPLPLQGEPTPTADTAQLPPGLPPQQVADGKAKPRPPHINDHPEPRALVGLPLSKPPARAISSHAVLVETVPGPHVDGGWLCLGNPTPCASLYRG